MAHKDGRFIWIKSKHVTILIGLPIGINWLTQKHNVLSINIYTA